MAGIHIRLLGRFGISDAAGAALAIKARKAPPLLALLAAHAPQPVRRDRLTGLLWMELPEERARHNLRQLLSDLRKQLPLLAGAEEVALDLQACTVDTVELRRLAGRDDGESLAQAIGLYQGELLDGADD